MSSSSPPGTYANRKKSSPAIMTVRASPAVAGRSTFEDDDESEDIEPAATVPKGSTTKKRPLQVDDAVSDDVEEEVAKVSSQSKQTGKPPAKRGRPSSKVNETVASSDSESSLGADIQNVKYKYLKMFVYL